VRVGRYLLAARLASGGMSSVHVGRLVGAAGFGRTVAVKQLHPHLASEREFVAMLLDEARLASRIRHPNVVSVSDVVQQDNQLLLVMDYVPGVSLAELIRLAETDQRRLPLGIVSAIGSGILHGLHAAHEATDERGRALGIVHRDVSPQNILVGADGLARVVDFGVAKAAGRLNTTVNGQVKGKMAYMAPEQLRSAAVDRRADVYAAALVLWEAITLARPFDGDDAPLRRIAGDVPAPSTLAPGIPAALDALLERALQRAPEHRTPDARAMALELEAAIPPASTGEVAALVAALAADLLQERAAMVAGAESGPLPSTALDDPLDSIDPPPGQERPAPSRRRRTVAVALVGTLLAASAGLFLLGHRSGGAPVASASPEAARAQAVVPAVVQARAVVPAAVHARVAGAPPASIGEPSPAPVSVAGAARVNPMVPGGLVAPPGPVAPAHIRGVRVRGKHRRRAAATSPERQAPRANCVPPFTIGSDGVKQYKIECL
jgi:hypothetical protein